MDHVIECWNWYWNVNVYLLCCVKKIEQIALQALQRNQATFSNTWSLRVDFKGTVKNTKPKLYGAKLYSKFDANFNIQRAVQMTWSTHKKRWKIAVEHAVPCSGSDITELQCTYVFYILATTLLNLKIRHGPKNCAVNRIHFMREAVWKMVVILPWNFAINNPWSLWKTFSINKAKSKRTLLCISKLILLSCWMRSA